MSKNIQKDIAFVIVDVFVAIAKTKAYVRPFSNEVEFRQSSSDWDAAVKKLNIIEETLNILLEDVQFNATSYLHNIVDLRDVIVHSDFGNDTFEVWDLITQKLVLLDNDLKNIVYSSNITMGPAIETELMKYFQLDNKKSVGFLKKLNREMY